MSLTKKEVAAILDEVGKRKVSYSDGGAWGSLDGKR